MNRKKFIQQSSVAAAGLLLAPSISFGRKEDIILGHNNKRYRIDTKWGQLDASVTPVKDCHEMVQDSKGRILLLTNETKNNVIIYDKKGKLISTWGTTYPGAHGLTLFNENGAEVLFICDNNRHQVIKTTIDGKELLVLDYPKETGMYTKADEYVPTETAIAANGDIYVADGYGKDFIIQYNYKGEYIRHFGGRGDKEENLLNAHGICIDYRNKKHPTLMITSRQQNAFKRYTMEGKYIETIALPGAWVCRPVIRGDYLYAAVLQSKSAEGKQSGFVTILDKNNKVVSNLAGTVPVYNKGVPEEMYQTVKVFQYPHDVCIDDEENLYIAQWNSGHVYPYKLQPPVLMKSLPAVFACFFIYQTCFCQTFQLAPPLMKYGSVFFLKQVEVTLSFREKGAVIRYTTNGEDPTYKSLLYTRPVVIDRNNTTVKAKSFSQQYTPSETVSNTFLQAGIPIQSISCTVPNEKYKGTGKNALIDNLGGNPSGSAGTWLGFLNDTVHAELDLQKAIPVKELVIDFLQAEGGWIFLPEKIMVYTLSEKDNSWQLFSQQAFSFDAPVEGSQNLFAHLAGKEGIATKKIAVDILPLKNIPAWHDGKGNHAWVFIDEIKVY